MSTLTVQTQSKTQTSVKPSNPPSGKRGSAAAWFLVEGKLICKWFPIS